MDNEILDLRLVSSFLTIVDEGTISAAAERLHLSQPALSRQLKLLEKQVGRQLLIRSNKTIALTEAGALLRDRARPLLNMATETSRELRSADAEIAGEIRVGAAESRGFRVVAQVAARLKSEHPGVRLSVHSGGGRRVEDGLMTGEFSFGLFIEPWDLSRYNTIQLPQADRWGVLVRSDSDLASREHVALSELSDRPVIAPERVVTPTGVSSWLGTGSSLNVQGTYNLLYNASIMVAEGIGIAIGVEGIATPCEHSGLVFVPFLPEVTSRLHLAWPLGRRLSPAEDQFRRIFEEHA